MSNKECSDLYDTIIDHVIQESRQDFEDSGIDEQTLMDLRKLWRDRLSKSGVAHFSWDTKEEDEGQQERSKLSASSIHTGLQRTDDQVEQQNQLRYEDSSTVGLVMPGSSNRLSTHGLHLPTTSSTPSTYVKKEEDTGIALPGASNIGQSDGSVSEMMALTIDDVPKSKIRQLRKNLLKHRLRNQQDNLRKLKPLISQADGAGEVKLDDGNDDSDDDSDASDDDSDLGSDLGVDSDEINSDLDDPEDDEINSDDENDDPEFNIMLCLYDRVQRVKNKWKCNLKEGIANIQGKDYAFQKATGDSEW